MGKRKKLTRKLLSALDLPRETDGVAPRITWVAREDLLVENHTGVLQCLRERIRLHTREGTLSIDGKEMELLELAAERAYVRGGIRSVAFETESGEKNHRQQ